MNKQEWLENELKTFKENLKKAADESFDSWYTDFLPYIEGDYAQNVKTFAEREIQAFLNDEPESWCHKVAFRYNAQKLRDKIFQEHKEELIPLINADLVKEVESLKIQLENSYKYRY